MCQRRLIALFAASTVVFAACGSASESDSSAGSATVEGDVVAVGTAPLPAGGGESDGGGGGDGGGGIASAIGVAVGALDEADDVACTLDRQILEAATESYEILNGALPTSQQDLLDTQMIRELSVRFEISAEGAVVAAPGSPCS